MQNAARDHITRARELEQKDQLDGALIEYKKAVEMDATNRLAATQGGRARAHDPRSHREVAAAAARSRRCGSRRGTQGVPVLNPADRDAAQDQLQQLEPARHPELHRHDHGHQHPVRSGVPGQGIHRQPRRRDARGGAAADPVGQRLLLQGAQPDDHRGCAGQPGRRTSSTTIWSCRCSTCRTPTRRKSRRRSTR